MCGLCNYGNLEQNFKPTLGCRRGQPIKSSKVRPEGQAEGKGWQKRWGGGNNMGKIGKARMGCWEGRCKHELEKKSGARSWWTLNITLKNVVFVLTLIRM